MHPYFLFTTICLIWPHSCSTKASATGWCYVKEEEEEEEEEEEKGGINKMTGKSGGVER